MLPERAPTRLGRIPVLPGLILERVWGLLGPLGRLLDALGLLWIGLKRLLCASWLSRASPTSILGAPRTNFEGPEALVLEDLK